MHSADWQIGKPYARVLDPDKRARLRQVRLEAIGRLADHARQQAVNYVVVAGDLFDSPTPSSSDVSSVCAAIGAIPCPVLVIPGNHDHGAPGTVWHSSFFQSEQGRRAPNLQVLLERKVVDLDFLVVLPCPLLRRSNSVDPCNWLNQVDWEGLPPGKPRLVIAHGSVQGFGAQDLDTPGGKNSDGDGDNPASANNRLRLDGAWLDAVDYIALGDWHGLKEVSPKAWYSGTLEPDRFPRSSDYEAGQVLEVELRRGEQPKLQPLATGSLGWHPLRFSFQADSDLDRLEEQLESLLNGRIGADLLLLEVSGSLSLAGHRCYEGLLERLDAQLLRLKLRGRCDAAPGSEELAQLTQRPGDPLIAQVATHLAAMLQSSGSDPGTDPQINPAKDPATARLALNELYRAVQLADASGGP